MKIVLGREVFDSLAEMAHPAHTALVVIDMQNDFAHPDGASGRCGQDVGRIRTVIPAIARLLEAARASGVTVVYLLNTTLSDGTSDSNAWLWFKTQHGKDPAYCAPGSWGHSVIDELAPLPGDIQVNKFRSSGFTHTNLDHVLRNQGIQSVVCCGCTTDGCVESTARDASFHDYYTLLTNDAAASFTPANHDASLLVMRTRYPVNPSDRYIDVWKQAGQR